MDPPSYYQRNRERILARQKEYNRINKEKISQYCKLYHRGLKRPPKAKDSKPLNIIETKAPPLPLVLDIVEDERPFNIMIDRRGAIVRFD